jgi:LysR family transcriptional regulator, regulatory protein for tcuABC
VTARMDMRQLRYYVQIVESGSLSKASRQLFIAQPALSQQMARLEGEVGKPLLIRSTKGVVPTENGEALYHHAKYMLRQLDEAVYIARQDYSNVKGRVTLGLAPTTVAVLGLPLLKHLRAKHPGIVLSIVGLHSGYLEGVAQAGQLDVAIIFRPNAASEMKFEPLLEEELFVILPSNSTLVAPSKRSLTVAEAARLPLVLPRPGHGLRRRIDLEFERAQVRIEQPVAEIDALQLVMQYVADGGGVTIQPMSALLVTGLPAQWRCLPISDARMVRTNYLYALPVEKLSASASIVRTEVKHLARDLIDKGVWRGVTPATAELALTGVED